MAKLKKFWIWSFYALFIFLAFITLSACGKNDLRLGFEKKYFTANENGIAYVTGQVQGTGNLYVEDSNLNKYKVKIDDDKHFKAKYELFDVTKSQTLKFSYIDPKDKGNKLTKKVKIKGNPEKIVAENKREEAEAEKEAEEERKREEAEAKREAAEAKKEAEQEKKWAAEEKAAEATKKPAGYEITMTADGNADAVHDVTKDEAGNYKVECTYVPMRDDFYDFEDYGDLVGYITVFPDGVNRDTSNPTDATYDEQVTSPEYFLDVHDNYMGGITTNASDKVFTLNEGNQIRILNATVKFTKQ